MYKGYGALVTPCSHLLTDNKTEMCTILLDQFSSVFSTPKPDMIISDPVSFFSCQSIPIGAELNYLSDNLMNMIDSSTTVDMIYLDFSKAFDKVDHGIVLHKLKDLGITGNLGYLLS